MVGARLRAGGARNASSRCRVVLASGAAATGAHRRRAWRAPARQRGAARLPAQRGDARPHRPRGRSGIAPSRPATAGSFPAATGCSTSASAPSPNTRSTCAAVRRLHARIYPRASCWPAAVARAAARRAHLADGARALAAGPAGQRRGGRQHLRLHRRGHRQGARDRHACRRGGAAAQPRATLRTMRPYAPTTRRGRAAKPRFDLYERANWVNRHPWLADLLIWRGTRSERVRGAWAACSTRAAARPAAHRQGLLPPLHRIAPAMCQLLGLNANTPTDVVFSFTGFSTRAEEHKDGFGIAFFEGRGLRVSSAMRRARGFAGGRMVRRYPIKSRNVIAHIRKATQGGHGAGEHPSLPARAVGRTWVFAHNGDLKQYAPRLHAGFRPVGDTDSERAFCWLMQELAKAHASVPSVAELERHAARARARHRGARQLQLHAQQQRAGAVGALLHEAALAGARASFRSARLADEDLSVDFSAPHHAQRPRRRGRHRTAHRRRAMEPLAPGEFRRIPRRRAHDLNSSPPTAA